MLVFLDNVSRGMDAGHSMDIIYLECDKIPHQRLLEKVKSHGIRDKLLSWIAKWLSYSKQWVQLQGKTSNWVYVIAVSLRARSRAVTVSYIY